MKLIGNLKKQVEETKNKEEAKEVIEKAGMELTDEELDQVAGGYMFVTGGSTHRIKYHCSCKNPEPGGRNAAFPDMVYCKNCGGEI